MFNSTRYRLVGRASSMSDLGRFFSSSGKKALRSSESYSALLEQNNNLDSSPRKSARNLSMLSKESSIASESFRDRWWLVPPAVTTHLCIGGLYAWSVLNEPLSRTLGVVVSAPHGDWVLSSIVPIFSTAVCFAGATSALSGNWAEKAGPRKCVFLAGTLWGGGLMLGGLGVYLHQLGLVYLGYGVIGGMGIGFAYSPPVAALLRFFPDRKGVASGMVIMGFGSGAVVALPAIRYLIDKNFVPPTYYGTADQVQTIVTEGRRFLVEGPQTEVVLATASDIAKLGLHHHCLDPGIYAVGTGSTGIAATLITLGAAYSATMMISSLGYKVPAPNWKPPVSIVPSEKALVPTDTHLSIPAGSYVAASDALRSRQFAQIWMSLFLNTTAGIALLGVAKTLMSDVFGTTMPTLVDATFCAGYVGALSLFNGAGRLAWATASDSLGRQRTYSMMFALGVPLYLSVPIAAQLAANGDGTAMLPLAAFMSSTLVLLSMYGGTFAVGPAYLADVFGTKDVGNIYGKLLTAWSAAGVIGPTMLAYLRRKSEISAMQDLATKADAFEFQKAFGTSVDHMTELIQSNAVTINKLLQICPPGTIDPSPTLYTESMQVMAGLLAVAFVNNYFMKPVHPGILKK